MSFLSGRITRRPPRPTKCIWHPCTRDATQHITATNHDGQPYAVHVCDQHHTAVSNQLTARNATSNEDAKQDTTKEASTA